MSGRPKIKVYEYTVEGDYLKTWDCIDDARKTHYPKEIGKRPLFIKDIEGYKFHLTKSNTILLLERPGREMIQNLYRIYRSKLCNFSKSKDSDKAVQMFNLKGELIAEFKNLQVAREILNSKYSHHTAYNHLKGRKGKGTFSLCVDYYFKYK